MCMRDTPFQRGQYYSPTSGAQPILFVLSDDLTWSLLGRQINHDPENYHDPFAFKPERFLGVDGRGPEMDPRDVSFGYGRRCVQNLPVLCFSFFAFLVLI